MINKHFKKEYTQEECDECFEWFETRKDRLPKKVMVPPCDYINDVQYYVTRSLGILKHRVPEQSAFSGEFSRMLCLREVLQRDYGIE